MTQIVWKRVNPEVKPLFPLKKFELNLGNVLLCAGRVVKPPSRERGGGIVYFFFMIKEGAPEPPGYPLTCARAEYSVDRDELICVSEENRAVLRSYKHYVESGEGIPEDMRRGLELLLERL